jgi:chromosome segregation ATPase
MKRTKNIFSVCLFVAAFWGVGHVSGTGYARAGELPDLIELKARLRASEGKLIEKEAYLRKILKEKDQYASELGVVETERMNLDAELKDAKSQLANAQESFSVQINSEKAMLNDKLLSLERMLKEKENAASKIGQEHGTIEKRLSDLEQENIHLKKTLEGSQKKVLDTQDEVTWKIYAMRQPLEDKISSLEGTIENNEAAFQEITQNYARVDAQLKKEQTEKGKMETELLKARKELAEAKALVANRMQEIRGPLEDKIQTLEGRLAQSNAAVAKREAAVADAAVREEAFRRDMETLTADNVAFKEKIGSLQGQIGMMEDDLPLKISAATKSLEDELSGYGARLQETVHMVKERQALLKDVLVKNDGLINEVNTLKNELSIASGEKESAVGELGSVNQQLYDMEKVLGQEIDTLKKRGVEDTGRIAALTQERDELSSALTALRDEKARMEREFAAVGGDLAETKAMIPRKIQEARQPLENQVRLYEEQLKASKDDLGGRVVLIEKLNIQINELNKALASEQGSGKKMKEDLVAAKGELERTKALIPKEVAAARAPLEERITVLERVIKQRDVMIEDISKQRRQLESSLKDANTKKDSLGNELLTARNQLRETRDALSREIEGLKNRGARDAGRIAALTQERDEANNDLTTLRDEKATLEREFAVVEGDLAGTKAMIPEQIAAVRGPLEEQIRSYEVQLKAGSEDLSSREALIARLNQQMDDLQAKLLAEQESRKKLDNDLALSRADLEKTRASIPLEAAAARGPLEEKIIGLEKTVKDKTSEMGQLSSRMDQAMKDLSKEQGIKTGLEEKLARLNSDLADTKAMFPRKIEEVTQPLENQIRLYEEQLKASKTDLSGRHARIEKLNVQIDGLNKELLAAQESGKKSGEELARTTDELKQALASVPKEVAAARAPLDGKITELTKLTGEKEKAITLLSARLDQTTRELLKEQGTKKGLEEQIRLYEAQLKAGNDDLSDREASIVNLNQRMDDLQAKLLAEQESRKKLDNDLALSRADLEKTKALIPSEVTAARAPLENKITDLENAVAGRDAEAGRLKERLDQVGKELVKEQEAKTALEGKLVKLSDELTKVKTSVPQQIAAVKAPLETRVVALEGMNQEKDAVIASLKKQKDDADGNLKRLSEEKGLLTNELASLKTQLSETKTSLGQELAGLKQKGSDDAGQIAVLMKANEHLNGEWAALRDKSRALEDALARAKVDMERTQALIPEKIASVREVLEGNIASLEAALQEKENLLRAAEGRGSSLEAELNEMSSRNSSLESELADVSDRLKKSEISISENMDALRRPMEKEIIEMESKIKSFEVQFQESASRVNSVSQERDAFKAAAEDLQAKNRTIEDELVKLREIHEGTRSSLGGQIQNFEAAIKEKDAAIANLSGARDKLKEVFTASENVRARLEGELAMARGKLEELKAQIPEKVSVVQKPLEEKIRLYEQQLTGANEKLREKEAFARELSQRLDGLNKDLVETQREKHGLKESLTKLEADMQTHVNVRTRDLLDEKVSLLAQIGSLKKALDEKAVLADDSAGERDRLRNELSALNEKKAALENEAALLRSQLKESEMSVSKSMDALRRSLEKEIIDLGSQVKAADVKLREKDALIAQNMDKQKDLAGELGAFKREKDLAQRELSTIHLQLQSADTALIPKIAEAKRPLEEKIAMLTAQLHNVDNAVGQKVQENQILYEERLKAVERKLQESESGLREKEMIIKELLQRKTETERALARAEEEKASLKASLEDINAKLYQSQEDFTAKIKAAESRSKIFKQDMSGRTVDLIEIRNELRNAMDLIRSSE